jgi:excisionase family DNA binding protein
MTASNDGLMGLDEAAAMLGVSKVTLRRWSADGKLPCIRLGGRGDRRFRPQDLESYIRSRMVTGYEVSRDKSVTESLR